jgi:hypothetical protein
MHGTWEPHMTAMKRILRFLLGTPDYGLLLRRSSSFDLVIYTDADWAGCPDTRRSMSGYAVFLGATWCPGQRSGRASSTAPAQRSSIASSPTAWLRPLGCVSYSISSRLRRLGAHLSTATILASCTYPPTPFNINTPNMWRLIFILSERRWPSVKSVYSMS